MKSFKGGKNLESAMDWCLNHPDDSVSGQKLGGESKPQQTNSQPQQQQNSQPQPQAQQPNSQPQENTNTNTNTTNTDAAPKTETKTTDNMQVDQPSEKKPERKFGKKKKKPKQMMKKTN